MNKVTYLFGAGASAGALPIINQIPDRLNELITFLKDNVTQLVKGIEHFSYENEIVYEASYLILC